MNPSLVPLDIWRIIFNLLSFMEQIKLRRACRYFYKNLPILELTSHLVINKLNDSILEQYSAIHSLTLNAGGQQVTKLSHLNKLKQLTLYRCDINEKELNCLTNLTYLFISMEKVGSIKKLTNLLTVYLNGEEIIDSRSLLFLTKLTSLISYGGFKASHITNCINLKRLCYNSYSESLTKEVLTNLTNLESLSMIAISKIENLNFLPNLEFLELTAKAKAKATTSISMGIHQCSKLKHLKLEHDIDLTIEASNILKLEIIDNNSFTNIRKLNTLTSLRLSNKCALKDNHLIGLTNLKVLDLYGCRNMKNFSFLTSLNSLNSDQVNQETINNLLNLTNLGLLVTINVSSVSHLTNLRELQVCFCRNLSSIGSEALPYLTKLKLYQNSNITSIENLTNLKELEASYCDDLSPRCLDAFPYLTKLILFRNRNKTSIENLTNLIDLCLYSDMHVDANSFVKLTRLQYLSLYGHPNSNHLTHLTHIKSFICV